LSSIPSNSEAAKAPEEVARAFAHAINRRDPDRIAELMTEDHKFVDSLGSQVQDRATMRAGWAAYFRMVPDFAIEIEEAFARDDVVVLLGRARGTYTSDGELRAENAWCTPAAWRAVIRDGCVAEWRIYADNEPIRRLMRG
jgi:uncharacterized protein (TIGR02246 family)